MTTQLPDRRKSIGGSDIAAILGLSPWRTPVDVWLEKTSEEPIPEKEGIQLRFGHFAEEFVAQEYSRKTGRRVQKHNKVLIHPEYPYLTGNVDRLVIPQGAKIAAHHGKIRTDRLLECKTASAFMAGSWGESGTDEIPLYYMAQIHWYMMLTGCMWADVAVLIGNSDFRHYSIPADFMVQEMMVKRAVHFWEECVIGGGLPQSITSEDVLKLYPQSKAKAIEATESVLRALEQVVISKKAIKSREKNKSELEVMIKDFLKDNDTLTHNGQVIATWKTNRAGNRTFLTYERMDSNEQSTECA